MSFSYNQNCHFYDGKLNLGAFKADGDTFETPCLIVSTYVGGLHYTTPDCLAVDLNQDNKHIGQLEISDLVRKDFGDIPLSTLKNVKQTTILSSRNVVGNVATTDATGINIDSFNGRIHIGVGEYVKRVTLDKPAAVIAFADEVDVNSGRKRLSKAVERSMTWFNELTSSSGWKESHNPFLFGVVVPVPELPSHTSQYSASLLAKGAQGLVVGCSHMGESEEVRLASIREVRGAAGGKVPVLIQGADTLRQILLSLSQGVDFISTNCPSLITAKGFAVCWGHKRDRTVSSSGGGDAMSHSKKRSVFDLGVTAEEQEEGEDGQPPAKKKLRETTTADDSSSAATATTAAESSAADKTGAYPKRPKHVQKPPPASDRPTTNQHRPIERCSEEQQRSAEQSLMLLWDNVYERDATPLVSGCKCHACKHHTKAYIHHLLIAKEMLGEVLLYHHNSHQLNLMMRMAREKRAESVEAFEGWVQEKLGQL